MQINTDFFIERINIISDNVYVTTILISSDLEDDHSTFILNRRKQKRGEKHIALQQYLYDIYLYDTYII